MCYLIKMNKININGRTYNCGRLFGMCVHEKVAGFVKKKEKVIFNRGIIAIWYRDASPRFFMTGQKVPMKLYYYTPDDGEEEILFVELKEQREWDKVYVFMYDEDGALLLVANRELLSSTGAYCEISNSANMEELKKCAWNIAALYGVELFYRVRDLDNMKESQEETLLEVSDD